MPCQKAFYTVKEYLESPHSLQTLKGHLLLLLYFFTCQQHKLNGHDSSEESEGKENAIYYLSKKFLDYEIRYSGMDKMCLVLIWATKK